MFMHVRQMTCLTRKFILLQRCTSSSLVVTSGENKQASAMELVSYSDTQPEA